MNFLEPGQEIETEIVAINGDSVFLDLNTKSEGVLDSSELIDKNGNLKANVGDKIKVFFLGSNHGEMKFTTKIAGESADKSMLENAYKNHIPVEGHVEKEIKGGYEIKIGDSRAFCPYSQMGYKQKEEASFFVGKHLTFKIQEFKENGRNILVSNRAICEDEHNEQMSKLQEKIKEGMKVKATVVSLHDYGAFVNIDGLQALLPISEISLSRVTDIEQALKVGQEIEVSVLKTDWKAERISVSLKKLIADPWEDIVKKYPLETKHTGTVARVADFGVFVTLEPGIDGLVHISELESASRTTNLRKLYKTGDEMSVVIKAINRDQHRLSLKPATSTEQDDTTEKYLETQDDSGVDTYNPFAALLKKK